MTALSLAALLLCAAPQRWSALTEQRRAAELESLKPLTLPQRLTAVSQRFLGTTYAVSPLGEGDGYDPDPRVRYDAVDCLTFVEETIAMCVEPTVTALLPTLDRIRYAEDRVDYGQRNHVMEAQWLPNNVKKGFLIDVTKKYGGALTKTATKVLDDAAWASKSGAGLMLKPEQQARGEFALDVIPADQALPVLKQVPEGTVLVVVRADRPHLVTRITHVGFLIHDKKGLAMRHASRTFGRVVDEPLSAYLGRNLGYARWTVEGFALFEVAQPPPQTAAAAP